MNEPILKKMEAAPISSAEFFTRSQARLTFDVPAGLNDPEIIPKTAAFNAPDRGALLVARPMRFVVRLFGPMLMATLKANSLTMRMAG